MTSEMGAQITLLDLDTESSKMFRDYSQATKEKTSDASLKRLPKSSKKMPLFLDLRMGRNGHQAGASSWMVGAFVGNSIMLPSGEYRNAENGFVYLPISTDSPQSRYCLLLNTGEYPMEEMPTYLSDILEEECDPKYNLSSRACQGILTRANRRGKKLPEILQKALEAQVME